MRAVSVVTRRGGKSAEERCREAWAEMAFRTRTDVRDMGISGPLRRLDEAASGTRGRAVPKGMAALAQEMRAHGVGRDEAQARLTDFAKTLVALVYHDGPNPAA
jgi:hypothetical protein